MWPVERVLFDVVHNEQQPEGRSAAAPTCQEAG
jgi:hypothetical protein